MEWYEVLKDLVSTLGFPIVVTCYLLWENRKLTETLTALKEAITDLKNKICG